MILKDGELTHKIIGCAMKVHSKLGNGFPKAIYHTALQIEFSKAELAFAHEFQMPIYYDGMKIGERRVDFLVENSVTLEIKALARLEDVHLAQAKNYLEAYNLATGLLINFGAPSLEFKRIFNNKIVQV